MSARKKNVEVKQLQSDTRLVLDPPVTFDAAILADVDPLTLAMRQMMQVPGDGAAGMK